MLASYELKYLLLKMRPSPTMMAIQPLGIQHHLEMIRDNLWAVNSMTARTRFKLLYEVGWLKNEEMEWLRDVDVATADMKNLLNQILDSKKTIVESSGRHLHCSCLSDIRPTHHRHLILVELKEMLLNLNYLMHRGSRLGLQRESMDSMDPLEEEYMTILKSEVVGRDEDVDKIIAILQQPSFNNHNDDDDDNDDDDNNINHDDNDGGGGGAAVIDDENDDPLVIVINGSKMVGKTTFARMINHHTWVCQYFHHRIWVDVDLNSSLNLTNMIVREFQRSIIKMGETSESVCKLKLGLPLQVMWEFVNEQLGGSRYFLVLDCKDFPNRLQEEWDGLKRTLLRVGGQGSAILITHRTRTEFDTDMLHGVRFVETYNLDGLSEDAWLKLFLRHHDASANPSEQPKLSLGHAKQLFKDCNGLPIWAKYTASFRYDVDWINFEFENDNDPTETFSLIRIRTFQYLSLFLSKPNPEVILHILIADGTILDFIGVIDEISYDFWQRKWLFKGDEFDLIEIIDEISEEFWVRKLKLEEGKFDPNEMEAIVGIQYLQIRVGKDSRVKIPRQCRHLCLVFDSKAGAFRLPTLPVEVSSKLRTLIVQDDETATPISKVQTRRRAEEAAAAMRTIKMLAKLVDLHTFYLETTLIRQLPREVSKWVNLRYLHISKNDMEFLPESLCSLSNLLILSLLRCHKLQMLPERIHELQKLQILELVHCTKLGKLPKLVTRLKNLEELNVEGCCWLMELPEDLSSMQTLRVLNIVGCASMSLLPHGIQKMINLRKLSGIFITAGLSDGSFGLRELQALTNLEELRLRNLERVSKTEDETHIEPLWMIQKLQYASLHWDNDMSACEPATLLQLLEAFKFNTHLKSIEVISYMGMEFPSWMGKEISNANSLVEVKLINLKKCSTLRPLGELENLRKLEISGMDSIKEVDDACIGVSLKELTFSEMPALQQLSIVSYYRFRALHELKLIQCTKLNSINMESWVLYDNKVNLWLNMEPWWSREFSGWKNMKFVRSIEIVGCQELRYLPGGMQNLRNLQELKIMSCNNLVALPNWLNKLKSLCSLHIYACPKLSYIPEIIKTHLRVLKIEECPKLQM
ncbi:putative disease resistance protein RGA4 [Zingiber officinale]|uniref:putative disease resistance protein RGA4 n=1 Tax=Zingiber officinale TaxID=94328 RepID=UPI001C4AF9E6|nr:putative disease resistance protein RGA4 [Zingiber officinale]